MSTQTRQHRITVPEIKAKKGREKIVSLTAYNTWMAQLIDSVSDITIVGDSLGMVAYGFESTLPVTLDMMIYHGAAVVKGTQRTCVVVDMPFGTYQESPQQAFRNCALVMQKTGAQAVKLEGGKEIAPAVEFLVNRGIPIMSHIGLMPQHIYSMGGFKAQGMQEETARKLLQDAKILSESGAFSLLIEGTKEEVAREITSEASIPTIGIGASPACDGQVLVTEDLLGLFSDYTPSFVKKYADIGTQIKSTVKQFSDEVRSQEFPQLCHCFGVKK
ncbi:3-methyl-2-oxobutanoate hydroxymethyltransferase [Candidatus Endobugula sertula]|uniref:3-methyl-2-oxobutanoate hydroxymethyltransferase n=1 Tax=Candidatus Endobugula sertula TaxID=62101 RepID=A0A1D2QLE7_9GAMM|nr:3-methyl-2-oxobutanoate hydroxymethyltransferase [Candidatus Endobugula sertula]